MTTHGAPEHYRSAGWEAEAQDLERPVELPRPRTRDRIVESDDQAGFRQHPEVLDHGLPRHGVAGRRQQGHQIRQGVFFQCHRLPVHFHFRGAAQNIQQNLNAAAGVI